MICFLPSYKLLLVRAAFGMVVIPDQFHLWAERNMARHQEVTDLLSARDFRPKVLSDWPVNLKYRRMHQHDRQAFTTALQRSHRFPNSGLTGEIAVNRVWSGAG